MNPFKQMPLTPQPEQIHQLFLKNISDFLPEYIFWKDTESVYLGCNENYAHLLGFKSPNEIIGKTDFELPWQIMGHVAENFQKADQETMAGHPITNQEEILSLPDGKTLTTLVNKKAIHDEKGNVLGILGYFSDITPLKLKEKALAEAKKTAEAANQAKSSFIANMRHSIVTPLSGLIGMIKILNAEVTSEKGKLAAKNAFYSAERLLDLLNEVIEIAKIESGTFPVYIVRFNLKHLLDTVVKLITPAIQEKNLSLEVNYDKKLPLYFSSDAIRVHRILLNLISNAVKFTDIGKIQIDISAVNQNDKNILVKVAIQDTGIGIPLEKQSEIFTRFGRLNPAYQGIYAGAGLGLAVVKQFVADLEGEIDVKSAPAKGSLFTCLLPLNRALVNKPSGQAVVKNLLDQLSIKKKTPSQQTTISKGTPIKQRVLLVEDDKITQLSVDHLLEQLNCERKIVSSGEEAVSIVQKEYFDLILMDIGLPGIDGLEATRQIRQLEKLGKSLNKGHCIAALSAHIDEKIKSDCLAIGMNTVFSKPFSTEKYIEIVTQFRK